MLPTAPGGTLAPTTATDVGLKSGSSECVNDMAWLPCTGGSRRIRSPYNTYEESCVTRRSPMQHFEGERTFAMPLDDLWPKLSDAAFLARCVPDASLKGEPEHDRAVYTVRPGF